VYISSFIPNLTSAYWSDWFSPVPAGRLDVGNEELVSKLKSQLRETHQELEDTRQALDQQTRAGDQFQEQVSP